MCIENNMVLELKNAPWNQEEDCEIEIETATCYYCGSSYPIEEMNTIPINYQDEYCCIYCLNSENE